MPRFELRYANGEDAGTFHTSAPDWWAGDIFRTGDGRKLRILRTIPLPKVEEFVETTRPLSGIWEVEPVSSRPLLVEP